jgi:hypothetical protein
MKKNVSKLQLILGILFVIYFFSIIIAWTYLRLYESNYCYFWGNLGVTCSCKDNVNCSIWYSFYDDFLFDIAAIVSPILIIAVIIYNIKRRRGRKKKTKKV